MRSTRAQPVSTINTPNTSAYTSADLTGLPLGTITMVY